VDAFLTFSEKQNVLPRSYRLPRRVKEYVDRWIHKISNRKEKVYEPRAEDGHVAHLDFNSPEEIVEHARRREGTSMILTTCGYMTLPFVAALKESGDSFCNPYRVSGDFASTWNPMLSGGQRAVTAADSLRAFLTTPTTFASCHAWAKEISADYLERGTKAMLKREKDNENFVPPDMLIGFLGKEGFDALLNKNIQWFLKRVMDPKRRSMFAYRSRVYQKHGNEGLEPTQDLIIGTIHSVKGGQADHVYLIPDLSGAGREAYSEHPDPITRQFYIGMTRARENLFLVMPKRRSVIEW
jgi:DNA helicase-2/ATP-dependent DNA helicase PcrA